MDISAFDKIKGYETETKEKWGNTTAFAEYETNAEGRSDEDNSLIASGMMKIFAEFGKISSESPKSAEAQNLVKKLQNFITENYYTCTDKILCGLGQMYVLDERFTENIDKAGGTGTAEFVSKAIAFYCGK